MGIFWAMNKKAFSWNPTQLYDMGIIINHYKDPYLTNQDLMESMAGFLCLLSWLIWAQVWSVGFTANDYQRAICNSTGFCRNWRSTSWHHIHFPTIPWGNEVSSITVHLWWLYEHLIHRLSSWKLREMVSDCLLNTLTNYKQAIYWGWVWTLLLRHVC